MGRERIIKATIAHSLKWEEHEERAVDQIAAMGLACKRDELGSNIVRIDALDAKATRKVILLTVRHLCHAFHVTESYAGKVALGVLHEYMRPNCIYCGGKGETHIKSEKVQQCGYCNGTGLHRYSNSDRSMLLGGKYNQRVYEGALEFIRDTARETVIRTVKRLGE